MRKLQLGAVGLSRSPVEAGCVCVGLLTARMGQIAHVCGVLTRSAPEKWAQIGPICACMGAHCVPWGRGAAGRKNPMEKILGRFDSPEPDPRHSRKQCIKIQLLQILAQFNRLMNMSRIVSRGRRQYGYNRRRRDSWTFVQEPATAGNDKPRNRCIIPWNRIIYGITMDVRRQLDYFQGRTARGSAARQLFRYGAHIVQAEHNTEKQIICCVALETKQKKHFSLFSCCRRLDPGYI